jgi:glycerol uptake facilitator-like aquaporin
LIRQSLSMEKGLIKQPKLKNYLFMVLYEYFGMVLFIVALNCSRNNAAVAALGLFVAATLTGRVSGGHFNMAITFAVYLMEGKFKKNLPIALLVIITDIIGAFTGMAIAIGFLGS